VVSSFKPRDFFLPTPAEPAHPQHAYQTHAFVVPGYHHHHQQRDNHLVNRLAQLRVEINCVLAVCINAFSRPVIFLSAAAFIPSIPFLIRVATPRYTRGCEAANVWGVGCRSVRPYEYRLTLTYGIFSTLIRGVRSEILGVRK
jgi:hypothetical protein